MRFRCNLGRLTVAGRAWTGRDATALRTALRLTTEAFAVKLAVSVRTVAGWAEKPGTVPRAAVQRKLDDAYAAAASHERARFAELASPEGPTAPQFFRVAMAVVTRGPDVLLVRRRDDGSGIRTGFPAGTVKPGDDAAATAVRETLNETGVACAVTRHLGSRVHPVTGVHCHYFACAYEAGEAVNRDEAENEGVLWVPAAEITGWIPRGSVFPPVLEALEEQHV
jgi:8-oxo-dGTP diphosphatase